MTALSHTVSRPSARHTTSRVSVLQLFAVWRQRRALAEMDTTRLSDIGLTAEQARIEASRPLWDVPANWLR